MNINEQQDRKNSDQTRDRLLQSGLELMAKKGYRGAVTREIALAAGVTEMTLYRHFRSKDELFAAAIVMSAEQFMPIIPEASGDIENDLLLLSNNMAKQASSIIHAMLLFAPELNEHCEIRDQISKLRDRFKAKFFSLLHYYMPLNFSSNYSDEMLYYMFIGPVFFYSLEGKDFDISFDNRQHVKFFLNELKLK